MAEHTGVDGLLPQDEVVDLDLHCVPDREHCVRDDDPHLDAVHLTDPRPSTDR